MNIQRFIDDKSFELFHNDHIAVIQISDIHYAEWLGKIIKEALNLRCTVCQVDIGIPISGGSDPEGFQRLAVLFAASDETGTKAEKLTKARRKVKKLIEASDPGRWCIEIDDEDEKDIVIHRERKDAKALAEAQAGEKKFQDRIKREAKELKDLEKAEKDKETKAKKDRADEFAAMKKLKNDELAIRIGKSQDKKKKEEIE